MLLPVLQREGHDVRALSRHPENLAGLPAEALRGDAVTGEGLERALDGVEVAYYLIHSMEPSPGGVGFVERERLAALNFGAAAQAAGVRRIVHLGRLEPRGGGPAGGAPRCWRGARRRWWSGVPFCVWESASPRWGAGWPPRSPPRIPSSWCR